MTVQAVERLQGLLSRVERNAKVPHRTTQGLGAFLGTPPPPLLGKLASADRAVAEQKPALAEKPIAAEKSPALAKPPAVEQFSVVEMPAAVPQPVALEKPRPAEVPAAAAKPVAAQKPVEPEFEIEVTESPEPPVVTLADAADLPLEDVSLDEISAVELDSLDESAFEDVETEDISVEVTSVVDAESPTSPAPTPLPTVAAASRAPFTAPPSLDDLRFSEPPPEPATDELAEVSESEPPPASAPHAISDAPESIDAALRAASEASVRSDEGLELETPLLTPPPESGPQVAVPPLAAPAKPTGVAAAMPTPEQLGEVIELEQIPGPPLELDERRKPEPTRIDLDAGPEELEFVPTPSIPSIPMDTSDTRAPMQTLVGGFVEEAGTGPSGTAKVPPSTRLIVPSAEAKPTRAGAEAARSAQAPVSTTLPAAAQTGFAAEETPTNASVLTPERIARGIGQGAAVVDVVAAAQAFRPRSFLELLDASVDLLKK